MYVQESCAIAKMTAQCALYMAALKIFGTPWLYTPTATTPNIFHGLFVNVATKFEVRIALFVPNIIAGTQKIWAVSGYAHAPFSPKFLIDFCSDWTCKCTRKNLKSVALPVPEIREVAKLQTPNLEKGETIGGRGWYRSKERRWVPISPPYILFLYKHSFARNFRLQFWVGVANPQFWGRGGRRGSVMVPVTRGTSSGKSFVRILPLARKL